MKAAFPIVPVTQWPEADRRLWQLACEAGEDFEEGGLAADWRPATKRKAEDFYGQYLAFLSTRAHPTSASVPLERASPSLTSAFAAVYAPGRADTSLVMALQGITDVVRACHPGHDTAWMFDFVERLRRRAVPSRAKHMQCASIDELLWLGEQLLSEGRGLRVRGRRREGAVSFRNGLIILALVSDPVRRANLSDLQIGRTLFIEGARVRTTFAAGGMKGHRPRACTHSEWLSELFLEYLTEARPVLMEKALPPDQGWVWIGRHGTTMKPQSFREITTRLTLQRLGRSVPPHNFRHSTASDVALLEPENVHITKDLLGHRSFTTTETYYLMAQSLQANSMYQDMIERRRGKK